MIFGISRSLIRAVCPPPLKRRSIFAHHRLQRPGSGRCRNRRQEFYAQIIDLTTREAVENRPEVIVGISIFSFWRGVKRKLALP